MATRTRLFYGVALLACLTFIALLISQRAATQQLSAAPGMVTETLYAPAGVGQLGASATVAWFIATPKSGEQYAVACKFVAESFVCKKGSFQ